MLANLPIRCSLLVYLSPRLAPAPVHLANVGLDLLHPPPPSLIPRRPSHPTSVYEESSPIHPPPPPPPTPSHPPLPTITSDIGTPLKRPLSLSIVLINPKSAPAMYRSLPISYLIEM
ncbi:hypothetical protein PCANC_25127 [Puccinia coronata f. sp. avenae]|nr:hypothetical protein PCANC_25127 [Puccinia coronata f. sp. avenae]